MSYETFALALRRTFIACSAGQKEPDPQTVEMYWSLFGEHDIHELMAALKAHVLDPDRGRFPPRPADITHQLQALDGHPSADEAWAIAARAHDERATVVWTGPISQAWAVASPLYERTPAQAAAAFKDAYASMVRAERANGAKAQWLTSLGHDSSAAAAAIESAANAGRLHELGHEERVLLEAPKLSAKPPDSYRQRWNELVAKLKAGLSEKEDRIPAELERTRRLKEIAQEKYNSARQEKDHQERQ